MNLIEQLNWRYATKRMNGTKIPQEKIDRILEAIRLAPTSFGLQAFKVIDITDSALREKIFNEACQQPQIKESSNILVFAANKKVTAEMVDNYMNLIAVTREIPVDALSEFSAAFDSIVAGSEEQNLAWTARQAYIAFGVGLVAAAEEEVDATPMEGFDPAALDKILGLGEQNLASVTILALGYRDELADYLASARKVRKSARDLFVKL
ncbi:MAG: nitroreductase family protein [Bacteroidales bacterium]|nr:nitroreductase family protein [Bacteroidales bacterium]